MSMIDKMIDSEKEINKTQFLLDRINIDFKYNLGKHPNKGGGVLF
jgi:hypothetical protein